MISLPPENRRRGFTLVELLVTCAIVAALSAVGMMVGKSAITRGRIVHSTENLRNLAIANVNYAADYGVFCPADDQWNNRRWHGGRSSTGARFDPTRGFLSLYLGESRQVGRDPLLAALPAGTGSFEEGTGGYGYNAAYIGGRPGGSYDCTTRVRLSERAANLSDPARTVMFATTAYARAAGIQEYPYCEPPFWDFGGGPSGDRPSPSIHFRANGKALVAWCDGHVTAEPESATSTAANPHGGEASKWHLGWFGPEENNGWWNPRRDSADY